VRKFGSGVYRANINVCTLCVRANGWQETRRISFFNDSVAAEPKWSQVINKQETRKDVKGCGRGLFEAPVIHLS